MHGLPFENRADAGRRLAKALAGYAGARPLILAIPRGGVPIGRIIADALQGELDVVLVRKLGAPGNPEFAVGAIDEQGNVMLSAGIDQLGIDKGYLRAEAARQLTAISERRARYGRPHAASSVAGRTVIVVDDGLATGATMTAALQATRALQPKRLICAVPVAARDSLAAVSAIADEAVCLATPDPFYSVGRFYRDFAAVEEAEALALLRTGEANPQP